MYNNNKSAYFISLIIALFSCGLIYYGFTFLELIPTIENFNELYRNSNQTYPELKNEFKNISIGLILSASFILISAGLMLTKYKYSIHILLVSLLGLCIFTSINFDNQSLIFILTLTTLLVTTILAYQQSYFIYRENYFFSDRVTSKLKLLVKILFTLIALIAGLFYFLLNSSDSNSTIETMVYEVKFSDGLEYKGEMDNNIPHGHGEMIWPNGKKYIGSFVQGNPEGQGHLIGPAGEKYDGELKGGAPDGLGKIELPNGYMYEGKFSKGAPNGTGKCYTPLKGEYSCSYVMGKET